MSFNGSKNVGPYRIIEQLGQGGMATIVYWDAGQVRFSLRAQAKAADLAGSNNSKFFESTDDKFK
jgi:hypothetical protein